MCDTCPRDCGQKFPSLKKTVTLSPEFLNTVGSKIYLQLPYCVGECGSNCNLKFSDFHFVAVCLKSHCRTTYLNLNDPECHGGELSDDVNTLLSLTQLPGTRVTLSRVGVCLERTNSKLWADLKTLFETNPSFQSSLDLCIEYWVECAACCESEETHIAHID